MHQQPRLPPQRTASPAPAPTPASVPASTPSPHSHVHSHSRPSSIAGIMMPSRPRSTVPVVGSSVETTARRTRGNSNPSDTTNTETQRLNLIMQNFFIKAAGLIIHSRLKIHKFSQAAEGPRYSRWFNLQTREFDDFREELKIWKNCSVDNLPPTLVIETYLSTSRLSPQQTLVAIDDDGKRWNVVDSMRAAAREANVDITSKPDVVLERWVIKLNPGVWKDQPDTETSSNGASLPAVYKRCILFFRALFTHTNLGAVFNYCQKHREGNSPLTPKIRITTTGPSDPRRDPLRWGLCNNDEPIMESAIDEVDLPVGCVSATWAARAECNLHIYDIAAVSGSHFIGMDDCFFQPSVPKPIDIRRGIDTSAREPPQDEQPLNLASNSDSAPIQTYGSLNTFHGANAISTSPLTALKQVKAPGSEASSYSRSNMTTPAPETSVPHSLPAYNSKFTGHSRLNLRDANSRRPSVSSPYSPFKAGSLSGSPRISDMEPPPSPQTNASKRMPTLAHTRNKSAVGLSQLRNPTPSGPSSMESQSHGTGSPRPSSFNKYSSSFPHRRSTLSISGPPSRPPDEDQPGSAQHSLGSDTAQPVSALFAESGGANSFQNDEGDLSDFLKMLDSKKSLRRFEPSSKGESTTSKTVSQLSKYMNMRESNNALSDSISASIMISKPPSVRRTSGASAVTWASSSPGKPQSPHAPTIPSRLSENSLAADPEKSLASTPGNRRLVPLTRPLTRFSRDAQGDADRADAIDIPISPRIGSYSRRPTPASVPVLASGEDGEEEDLPFGDGSLGSGGVSLCPGNDESSPSSDPQAAGICGVRIPPAISSVAAQSSASRAFDHRKYNGVSGAGSGSSSGSGIGRGQTPPSGRASFLTRGSGRMSRGGGENEMFAFELLDSPVGRMSLDEPTRPANIPEGTPGEGVPVASPRPQQAPEENSDTAEGSFEPRRAARRAW